MARKAFDFSQHVSTLNELLSTSSKLADQYQHNTGKGDFRENLIIDAIQSKLPSQFTISKGEIIDSDGARTPEFDLIIAYQSQTPRLFSLGSRVVLPVEDVVAVIEIKSNVGQPEVSKFANDMIELNKLKRYYEPTVTYKMLSDLSGIVLYKDFDNYVLASEQRAGVRPILGLLIGFHTSSPTTAATYFSSLSQVPSNLLGSFCLDGTQVIKDNGTWRAANFPNSTMMVVLKGLFEFVRGFDYQDHIRSQAHRYYKMI